MGATSSRIKRALLVFCIGPLPVGLFALLDQHLDVFHAMADARYWVAIASLLALWGLTAGILRQSLPRAIVGLNAGALMGFWISTYVAVHSPWAFAAVLGAGVVLGALLKVRRTHPVKTLAKGAMYGGLSFGAGGLILAIVVYTGSQDLLTFLLLIFLPFAVGPALFLHWMADAPPKPAPKKADAE